MKADSTKCHHWLPSARRIGKTNMQQHLLAQIELSKSAVVYEDVPKENCSCGIYAARDANHLEILHYAQQGICGEVYLWGKVVEHEQGYRAQFAYPKNFVIPIDMIPYSMREASNRLQTSLFAYGVPVFIRDTSGLEYALWSPARRVRYPSRRLPTR
jgi:hypothetical protein